MLGAGRGAAASAGYSRMGTVSERVEDNLKYFWGNLLCLGRGSALIVFLSPSSMLNNLKRTKLNFIFPHMRPCVVLSHVQFSTIISLLYTYLCAF